MKETILRIFNPENEFFKLANNAKRITHISFSSIILPVVFLVVSGLLTQYVVAPLFFGDPTTASSSAREALGLYSLFGILLLLVFIWVRFYEQRPFYTIGLTKKNAAKKYFYGFSIGMGMNIILVAVLALLGMIEQNTEGQRIIGINTISGVLIFLFAYIIQGSSEEILTRGWMFQVIGARYKPWIGAVITSVVFSLMHSGNDGANVFSSINIFLIALLLSLFVMKDGSIWSACGWHTAWNWTLGNVFGLSVSGTGEKASLFNLNVIGNELLSGGEFGIEGSVILTLLLIGIISLICLGLLQRTKSIKEKGIVFAN